MIIGITGTNCSGKETAANYLVKKGYEHFSLSDIIREELTKKGLSHSRKNLFNMGNKLRKEFGENILALRALKRIKNPNTVISSIRNPNETTELKKQKNLFLIAIDAPIELRFERSLKRAKPGEEKTFESFKNQELDESTERKGLQQIRKCIKMADTLIINDKTIDDLYKKIDEIINKFHT